MLEAARDARFVVWNSALRSAPRQDTASILGLYDAKPSADDGTSRFYKSAVTILAVEIDTVTADYTQMQPRMVSVA